MELSQNKYENVINVIKTEGFYIYGAGKIGKRTYEILRRKELLANFAGFVVTSRDEMAGTKSFAELYTVKEIKSDRYILVAVDFTLFKEIERILINSGFDRFCWFYPYLIDLAFGRPVMCKKNIEILSLLKKTVMANWIAVCFLALEGSSLGQDIGKKLYIKIRNLSFKQETSLKDYARFVSDAKRLEKEGYVQSYPIKISTDEILVIDGAHRVAMAVFCGKKEIIADYYHCSVEEYERFSGIGGGNGNVTETKNLRNILTLDEILFVEKAINRMKSILG